MHTFSLTFSENDVDGFCLSESDDLATPGVLIAVDVDNAADADDDEDDEDDDDVTDEEVMDREDAVSLWCSVLLRFDCARRNAGFSGTSASLATGTRFAALFAVAAVVAAVAVVEVVVVVVVVVTVEAVMLDETSVASAITDVFAVFVRGAARSLVRSARDGFSS